MEIGIYSFVDNTPDPETGITRAPEQRMQDLLEEIELADRVGLDVFGIGEHHRPEYLASTPATILAAAARTTKNIRLSSAVSVLGSDDPVRVYQDFATLDLISRGRSEIIAGRGSFVESFPLFGFDLSAYDEVFSEKLELLTRLGDSEKITWTGTHRPRIQDRGVYPRPLQKRLPIWLAVGGTPKSVVRAAELGLPLALAIIGGMPERFVPMVELYRKALQEFGRDPADYPVSINSHGYVSDSFDQAFSEAFPPFAQTMNRIGQERGWPPISREHFRAECGPQGAQLIGGPQELIDKMLFEHDLFGHQRMMIQLSVGTMPHDKMLHAIELLGTQVAPAVRKAISTPS